MGKLTVAHVRRLSESGRYGDGETLFLNVARGGSKSWIQRITIDGHRRDIGLGGWPVVSLAEARELAFENRRVVRRGGDPLAEKRRARMPTFREAARRTFDANRPRWRNAKHVSQWMQTLERHALPKIGGAPVDRITQADVLHVLTPIWTERPETARKVRQRIRSVFAWCQAHGYVENNAAGEGINGALPSMPKQRRHYRALPYSEVAGALDAVDAGRASLTVKACLRFVVLTACRSGEARGATWDEIDLDAATWTIPAERTKTERPHRVPLSVEALAVLRKMGPLEAGSGLVFPSPQRAGRAMSDMTLTKALRNVGLGARATVHGFRTSFRTWASERTNAEHAVMELCLSHTVGSAVEQAYARSDLFDKRRRLMDRWATYLGGGSNAKVVLLHG